MSNNRRTQNSADAHWFVYKLGSVVPRNVTHAIVHYSVEVLPARVFRQCRHLKEVEIQEGLREIGAWAFWDCVLLGYVTLPSTLKKICKFAFGGCQSLREIILPEGLTEIGNSGFGECTSLKRIRIPSAVTTFGDYAFHRCTSLKAVRLVDGIRTIGKAAFSGCDSLDDIMLPATLAEICKFVFTPGYGGRNSVTPQRVTFRDGILAVGAEATPEYRDYELVVVSSKAFVVSKRSTGNYSFQFVTEVTIPKTESGQVVIASEGFNLLRPTDMPEVERAITRILGRSMLLGWNEKRERLLALVAPYEVQYKKERTTLLKLCLWKKVDANGAAFIVPQVLSYL